MEKEKEFIRTEETRRKMSESQKKRYQKETQEQKEKRINNIKSFYKRANALMMAGIKKQMEEAYRQNIIAEYERLKNDGLI